MVAVVGQTAPPAGKPPPPMPHMPEVGVALQSYMTQFSIWCRENFAAQIKSNVALPGVLLQANDTAPGATPKVFMIQVTTAGAIVATPVSLGNPP
jgi:hypothetical protein